MVKQKTGIATVRFSVNTHCDIEKARLVRLILFCITDFIFTEKKKKKKTFIIMRHLFGSAPNQHVL